MTALPIVGKHSLKLRRPIVWIAGRGLVTKVDRVLKALTRDRVGYSRGLSLDRRCLIAAIAPVRQSRSRFR